MSCYSLDKFRGHFRMTRNTFESLSQEFAATGSIPPGNGFGRKAIPLQKQVLSHIRRQKPTRSALEHLRSHLLMITLVVSRSMAIQAKRPRTGKTKQMEHAFLIRKFRLGVLDYLSRIPFSRGNFRSGRKK